MEPLPPPYQPYYLHQPPPEIYYLQHQPEIRVPNPTIHIPKHQRHINTLFVSGLPDDVIPREIHNLFRRRPGFDSCQLKFTGRANQESTIKASQGDLRPCSTLFIANLGPKCSEDELREALSQYSGFNGLKLHARGGMPVAFVDFEEVEQASQAMEALQDSMLPSSDSGMHIEFARSKMRKP